MKKITPETERKLMAVIEKTAELVGKGAQPTDAIVKAARDHQLRPGDVSLVVHAYNTGRTTRQRQDGENLFEKAAEFELADTAAVLEALYPTTVKTASAIAQDTTVSPEYSYSPQPMLERKQRWEKRAQNIDWRTLSGQQITEPAPLPSDPNHRLKVASAQVDRMRKTAEESRREMSSAFDQLGHAFMDLTTYFKRPDAKPIPVVKEAVILLHGDRGEQLMDQLILVTPTLTKLANHRVGQSLLGQSGRSRFADTIDSLDCTAEPFNLVATVMERIADYKTKEAAYKVVSEKFAEEAGKAIRPFVYPAVSPSILEPSWDETEKKAFMDAPDPLKMLGAYGIIKNTLGPVAQKLKGPDDDNKVNKAMGELNDPSHEMRLREINTQAMLQDLLLNDPVISGYDPDEVTGAFNDITQISPSVADQRMLMQGLLRKKLQQGQLDTFEQDQLLGFEDKLRRQAQPVQPMAGKSHGSII